MFFFFKQKTAYDMRISDWSSDVCSSDLQPLRMQSDALRYFCRSAFSPVAYTPLGKTMAAACEVFENVTRRYRKPDWNIDEVSISGHAVPVEPEVVRSRLFRSAEHTSELQSLMRISYAVFCLKKKIIHKL